MLSKGCNGRSRPTPHEGLLAQWTNADETLKGEIMATLKVPVGPDDHVQGNAKAPITLDEYGDYECPACGLAYPIVLAVQKHFGRDLKFVFRNFPLAQVHPNADSAAETAEWAASHHRFWEMHDALYENQAMLGLALYLSLANALGLPDEELSAALENRIFYPKVRADFMGGVRSGVNGTPTFFINGRRHDDSFDFAHLVASIDMVLEQAGTS
jgi:protein-disulfide isomerase